MRRSPGLGARGAGTALSVVGTRARQRQGVDGRPLGHAGRRGGPLGMHARRCRRPRASRCRPPPRPACATTGARATPLPDARHGRRGDRLPGGHWFDAEVAVLECARSRLLAVDGLAPPRRPVRARALSAIVRHAENIPEREDPPRATRSFDAVGDRGVRLPHATERPRPLAAPRRGPSWRSTPSANNSEQVRELGSGALPACGLVEIRRGPAPTCGAPSRRGSSSTRSRASP